MSFTSDVKDIIKNTTFYGDTTDLSLVYAEFCTHQGTVKRFTTIHDSTFLAYIRGRIRNHGIKKMTASQVIEYIEDYYKTVAFPTKVDTYMRTAGNLRQSSDGTQLVEYSLNDDSQQFVVVTPQGWEVKNSSKHKFVTFPQILPQVIPKRSNSNLIELISKYVNLNGDMLKLFVIWLVQCFSLSSHFALVVSAERGSGKSSLGRLIRALCDPSSVGISTYPNKIDDLQSNLSNSYLAIFDNMSDINKAESDLMCSAVTGATVSKRALYTNGDLYVQKIHSVIVMNGICVFPNESDLAERCLLVRMKKLSSDNMRTESTLWSEFERDKPYILGLIFDTLSLAMGVVESLKNEKLPRMADAYLEMMAIALAIGVGKDEFKTIYEGNKKALEKERSNTPIVEAIREFMNSPLVSGRKASGAVDNLYRQIKANYSGDKRDLPKSAARFSYSLKSERNTLDIAGFTVNLDDTHSDGTHLDIIKKKAKT